MDEEIKIEESQVAVEEDFKDKYLRQLAEMENMRKRMGKEKQEMIRFGIENAIADFLPVIDQFENALLFAKKADEAVKNWAAGFQMFLSQFKDVLTQHGITPFVSKGQLFDPALHEALDVVETTDAADGIILEELAKGYKSASRTIRPARVKVAKKPVEKTAEASAETFIKEELLNPKENHE